MLLIFLLVHSRYSVIWVTKCMNKPLPLPWKLSNISFVNVETLYYQSTFNSKKRNVEFLTAFHLNHLLHLSGPDSADVRLRLILFRPTLPLLRGKNGKALINLRKIENDDIDALKVRTVKNYKSLLECPTTTALVAAFNAKAFSDKDFLKSYLADGNRIINFCKQTNRKCHD